MKETKNREPGGPQDNLVHVLDVHHSKNKYEFVEHKVPELVLDVLQNEDKLSLKSIQYVKYVYLECLKYIIKHQYVRCNYHWLVFFTYVGIFRWI